MATEEPPELTPMETQIAAMRIQGLSYRRIAEAMGKSWSTVNQHALKPHVKAVIAKGQEDVIASTVHRLSSLRGKALDLLEEIMAEGFHETRSGSIHDRRVDAAREIMKATEVKRSEVKVSGMAEMIAAAVAEMTDEELGINDADNEPTS